MQTTNDTPTPPVSPSAPETDTQLGADTSGVDQYAIDFDPTDPHIVTAVHPSPDPDQPLSSVRRLLLFTSGMGGRLIASVALAICGVIVGLLPYVVIGRLLSALLSDELTGTTLITYLVVAGITYLIARSLLLTSTLISHRVAYRTLYRVRVALTQKLGRIPLGRIVDTPSGQLKKVFVEDIQACELPLAHLLPELTSHLAGPVLVIIYLFVLDWRLAVGAMVPIVAGIITMCGMFVNYQERFARFNQTSQKMNATIVEYVRGISVIKAFNQSSSSFDTYTRDVHAFRDATVDWFRSTQVWSVLSWVLIPSSLAVLVPWGAYMVSTGSLTLDNLLLACALSIALGPSLFVVAGHSDTLSVVLTALDDVMAWFEEPEVDRPDTTAELGEPGFSLVDTSFQYHPPVAGKGHSVTPGMPEFPVATEDDTSAQALDGVNLDCPPGSFTALVGPSGAGKSTVGRLLAGYWDATDGTILFGGVEMRRIPQSQLMRNLSYVTQDNYLFDTTIAANLRVARPDATDDELWAALDAAGCSEFMKRLPDGLDSRVGGSGTHLSGGERQRITIARALLKDTPVVILDEATSYLDPASEAHVQQALTRLTADKTLIVIAHRLSTITEADRLYVLDQGRVVQTGTHDELATTTGLYAQLWTTHQAARRAAGQEME